MRLPIALATLGLAAAASAAHASPQILALLSTDGLVPLHCQGSVCSAELSAFCLERHRATPDTGTAYRAAANAALVVVVTGVDSRTREFDARALAEFTTVRDMTAVRISIDRGALGDAARVSIRSGSETALLPVHQPRFGPPRKDEEIAQVTGPARAKAAQVVDHSAEAAVARDLARSLDALRHQDETAALWLAGAATPVVRGCVARVADEKSRRSQTIGVHGHWTGRSIVGEPSLKSCLEEAHASLMTRLNHRFWNGERPEAAVPRAAPRM
jgi:hypothetical protein